MAVCRGTATEHCCWIDGGLCPFVEITGQSVTCTLRAELGSWDKVHADARYLRMVQPMFDRIGGSCGDYPPDGQVCAACGVSGG